MKLPGDNVRQRLRPPSFPAPSSSSPPPFLPRLPPPALRWSAAASAAAAISYADRGTSAVAASSLLEELRWSEGQLGEVQGAFFLGYALTQVLGGILGGSARAGGADGAGGKAGGYRIVLPLSLFLTGATTLLFPLAVASGGPAWASADRFVLGLLEGLLLPAAMAGVSDTTAAADATTEVDGDGGGDNKATASAIVIAGCYLGSAWAYLSAYFLFGEGFQLRFAEWGYEGSTWPLVFYVNGILSMICLLFFRREFNLVGPLLGSKEDRFPVSFRRDKGGENVGGRPASLSTPNSLWKDTLSIAKATLASKSGLAILTAQIGQGALLYSIASWGPLYLERVNPMPPNAQPLESIATSPSAVAVAASAAAKSLILPQLTQALVGVSIGATADRLSSEIGTRTTRRALQVASGVGPAAVLWYLSWDVGPGVDSPSPAFLFGMAQTFSALSLGAVSVSHLDVAAPSAAGAVYALGNVAAAASGSFTVNLFGRLLEEGTAGTRPADQWDGLHSDSAAEFALPFRVVAILSAVGSLVYGCTVETELEIDFNRTDAVI